MNDGPTRVRLVPRFCKSSDKECGTRRVQYDKCSQGEVGGRRRSHVIKLRLKPFFLWTPNLTVQAMCSISSLTGNEVQIPSCHRGRVYILIVGTLRTRRIYALHRSRCRYFAENPTLIRHGRASEWLLGDLDNASCQQPGGCAPSP